MQKKKEEKRVRRAHCSRQRGKPKPKSPDVPTKHPWLHTKCPSSFSSCLSATRHLSPENEGIKQGWQEQQVAGKMAEAGAQAEGRGRVTSFGSVIELRAVVGTAGGLGMSPMLAAR